MKMKKEVEKYPAPRNAPTADLKAEWGYFIIFDDGSVAFEKGNVTNQQKIHALKTIYLIEI